MPDWITTSPSSVVSILVSCFLIFVALVILTRLIGLRSFSKMSSFDFAMTIAVGSILTSVLLNKSTPLADRIVALVSVFVLQYLVAFLRKHTSWVSKLFDNEPKLLMLGNKTLYDNLKSTRVTKTDLIAKLREENFLDFYQVRTVVLETTGDISILRTFDETAELSDGLLESVKQ